MSNQKQCCAGIMLHVTLLGAPALMWSGRPLPMHRRQTRALLYRLAVDLCPVPRAQLCYLFWPDVPDATARRNLSRLLVLVRRSLPDPTVLVTEDERVSLDRERVWSDTAVFVRLAATVDPSARLEALRQAVELVRGPFLHGFALPDCPEFEAWMDGEHRTWEQRSLATLAVLIEAHTAARDYHAAIAAAHRYLQADELAEDIHRRLIALYAAAGDRTAALRQFERCVVVLERELGVSPLPETRAVFEAVRDGKASLPRHTQASVLPLIVSAPPTHAEPARPAAGIPVPASSLIGRSKELAEVTALLRRADVRLLTLSGPGGAGKTRLAIEAARVAAEALADGAVFVSLAPVRDAALVIPAIMQALSLPDQSGHPPLVRLQEALHDRDVLLVLDNFEHVAAAAVEVAALLAAASGLTVLVTSRVLLRIAGEHSYPVPPLALADPSRLPPLDALVQVDSVALFLARVRMRLHDFRLTETNAREVAAICARLDGLPLAIELAAARAALLSPRMLLARLSRRLTLLTGGATDLPERQRTLRATIDWSYHLLDLSEQLLLGRLAVFAGSWGLEAAEAICGAVGPPAASTLDGLQALLDKHLLQRLDGANDEPRFVMLETIREYASERLAERGEAWAAQHGHARYYLALAETAAPALHGPAQIAWFDRLDEEQANLRVALAWSLESGDNAGALRLAGALHWFWYVRGHLAEGRTWLEQALAQAEGSGLIGTTVPRTVEAQAQCGAGLLALFHGDLAAARSYLEASATACRIVDDHTGQITLHETLMFLVVTCVWQGDFAAVGRAVAEYDALVRSLDEPWTNACWALNTGRAQLHHHGDATVAQTYLREAQVLFRALGDVWHLAQVLLDLGAIALGSGDVQTAQQYLGEGLAAARALKDRALEANALNNLGEVARLVGDDTAAAQHYEASLRLYRDLDSKTEIPRLLHNLGYLALHRGDTALARAGFVESLLGFRAIGQQRGVAEPIAGLACVQAHAHTTDGALRAARLWGAADAIYTAERAPVWPADRVEHAHYQALARDTVGASAFETAYADGAALSFEQVVSEAMRA